MNRRTPWLPSILMLLLGACASNPRSEQKVQAEKQWNQVRAGVKLRLAAQQHESGLFADCIETVTEALALDASRPEAYVLLARSHLELNRSASAQQVLDAAKRADLSSADLLYTEGVLLEQRGRAEEALEKYAEASAKNPTHLDAFVAQVECLVTLNRLDEAFTLAGEQGQHFDDRVTVSTLTARVALLLGNSSEALKQYAEAWAAAPNDRRMAEEYGCTLMQCGQFQQAAPVLRTALDASNPEEVSPALRRAYAECSLSTGDPVAAKTILADYALAQPLDTTAQMLLAQAAIALHDHALAHRAIRSAELQKPLNPEIRLLRAVFERQRGRLTDAQTTLESLLAEQPLDVEARCLLGELLIDQQDRGSASQQFQLALRTDPQNAWARAGITRSQSKSPTDINRR